MTFAFYLNFALVSELWNWNEHLWPCISVGSRLDTFLKGLC